MATVQQHLMDHWDDARSACFNVPQIPYRAEEVS